ncbi:hypothetical protein KC338_g19 [Hortaea werneckii]|nr:hypothetical protein KC338_g19 [Hortaea werneckii]
MAAAAALRQKQAPIKDEYKSNPSSAVVTLSSSGTLDSSSITCKLDTGKAIHEAQQKVAGLHQKAGGDDPEISGELCSGDMLLEALVACAGVTLRAVSTARSQCAGREVPEEKIEKLGKLTERYCVVLQTIAKKPELSVSVRGTEESKRLRQQVIHPTKDLSWRCFQNYWPSEQTFLDAAHRRRSWI